MQKLIGVLLFATICAGCGEKPPTPAPSSPGTGTTPTPAAALKATTPEEFIKVLVDACTRKDKAAAGACISEKSSGEFAGFRTGAARDKDWDSFFGAFSSTVYKSSSVSGDKATVEIDFTEGGKTKKETIELVKEGDVWKLQDM